MSRTLAVSFGVAVALATLWPVLGDAEVDSFPFSTYPMFARTLTKPRLLFAEGVLGGRETLRLGPELVANDEPMQAMRTLKLAAKSGRPALRKLCARIAAQVAETESLAAVRRVRIVKAAFDPVAYFEVAAAPEQREVLMQCRTPGRR